MYLPIQINMPVLIGGFVSHLVNKVSEKKKYPEGDTPKERGTLIASGFIAGGALMGVVGAVLNLPDIGKPIRFISIGANYVSEIVQETRAVVWNIGSHKQYFETLPGQLLSLAGFIGLCVFCYKFATKVKGEQK